MDVNYRLLPIAGLDIQHFHSPGPSLKRIGFGLTTICNHRCIYCLTDDRDHEEELEIEEYDKILMDAIPLGLQTVVIVGEGEPTCSRKLIPLLRLIRLYKLSIVLFTNGQLLRRELLNELVNANASVIVKINALNAEVHDALVDFPGSYKNAMRTIRVLREAGFSNAQPTRLGIQSVITADNLKSIEYIWNYARSRNIFPYIETLRRRGRASFNPRLIVPKEKLKILFESLQNIDKNQYGFHWNASPPYVSFTCQQHTSSCFICADGNVTPCSGLPLIQGSIRRNSLSNILASETIKNLRNLPKNLKGACRVCPINQQCYGCRANAWSVDGDYLAEDPDCWVNL